MSYLIVIITAIGFFLITYLAFDQLDKRFGFRLCSDCNKKMKLMSKRLTKKKVKKGTKKK